MKDLTAARKYTSALFDLSKKNSEIDQTSEGLGVLKHVFRTLPEFRAFIFSFRIETGQKLKTIKSAMKESFTPLLSKFMKTLIDNKKQELIPDISDLFDRKALGSKNKVLVIATTPKSLESEMVSRIKESLEEKLEKDVVLESKVDPSIIGGMILRVGNTVIDGSVRGKLARMRKELLT